MSIKRNKPFLRLIGLRLSLRCLAKTRFSLKRFALLYTWKHILNRGLGKAHTCESPELGYWPYVRVIIS